MAERNRNRNSNKSSGKESRSGNLPENRHNKKLPDLDTDNEQSMSTEGDTANPKYSKTKVRKEDKEKRESGDGTRYS
jgi:hypothetical protein